MFNIKNLSFPDFDIEKIEFSQEEKTLKIFIEGAWLEENGGELLGRGILFFHNWESISIHRFNSDTRTWTLIDNTSENLTDLCEVNFFNSDVSLFGFGTKTGKWLEWRIKHTEAHAEFESHSI